MIESTIRDFAKLIYGLQKNDRDVTIGCGGFTGEGKSTFLALLEMEHSRISGVPWSFKDNCTWSRDEFKGWVDGNKKLKIEQKPEYSAILLDELFSMFYRRNWHNDSQKEAISILNMCRDRHLLIAGNVPLFWDLDGGFLSRVRYYVYIASRGVAWIFQQENNPFSSDPWNVLDNKKRFRKGKGQPYKLPNFVAQIKYPDLSETEKAEYLSIRNSKRIQAQKDIKKDKVETYAFIKRDRDNLIRAMHLKHKITQKQIMTYCSLKKTQVSNICLGIQ